MREVLFLKTFELKETEKKKQRKFETMLFKSLTAATATSTAGKSPERGLLSRTVSLFSYSEICYFLNMLRRRESVLFFFFV